MRIPAEPYYDEGEEKWIINIYDPDGDIVGTEKVDTEKEANKVVNKIKQRSLKDDKKEKVEEEKEQLEREKTFLEKALDEDENLPANQEVFGDPMHNEEEVSQLKKEHEDEFTKKESSAKTEAKNLLLKVAKLYLATDTISDNDYIKFKLQIEEKGLSSLMFQLDITRKAIYKLSEKIHMDEASPRHFEVLTGLNRVVLEITKYQQDHIANIEESMKKIQSDMEDRGVSKGISDGNDTSSASKADTENIDDDSDVIISTKDRKQVIDELNKLVKESKDDLLIPQSKNERLHDDDPEVVEGSESKYWDESEEEDMDDSEKETGLETFEEEDLEKEDDKENDQKSD